MASTTLPTLLTFPHPTLTKIHGKPTNTTIKLLRKEVYANARAIPSTHGGGAHGHLGLIMPAAEYLALAGQAFDLPAHPGAAPVHGAAATAAQIAETIRIYNATLADLATANTVRGEIKKQIIEAVDRLYLAALEDEDFGFADVTVTAMLTHLQTTYGPLTRVELEENRSSIATAWNLDDPIEHLWARLREIKRISIAGHEELADATIMELTFLMFEKTGVFTTACDTWRVKPTADKTLPNFREHFTTENQERLRKLTAAQAGFHGANAATPAPATPSEMPPPVPAPDAVANNTATTPTAQVITNDGVRMYYCWTHGLGTNSNHTSASCQRKAEGHQDDATVTNMQGGNNTIMSGRSRRRLDSPRS